MAVTPQMIVKERAKIKVEKFVPIIDEKLLKSVNNPMFDYDYVLIEGEPSKYERDMIAAEYIKAGWFKVYHQTSSENDERPGLTEFVFVTRETNEYFKRQKGESRLAKYYCVDNETIKFL